ncbi:hypothetical protein BURPS668_0366 [Burkholderia pseudomallei 668]|nr:hypothetical protein BURPS668_0366 [Burkholderia pseudomallei 668]
MSNQPLSSAAMIRPGDASRQHTTSAPRLTHRGNARAGQPAPRRRADSMPPVLHPSPWRESPRRRLDRRPRPASIFRAFAHHDPSR